MYTVLRSVQWTLVTTDHWKTPIVDTLSNVLYVRLHGAAGAYVGDYGPVALQHWADLTARFLAVDPFKRSAYIFFNNNDSGVNGLTSSVVDATYLATLLTKLVGACSPVKVTKTSVKGEAEPIEL